MTVYGFDSTKALRWVRCSESVKFLVWQTHMVTYVSQTTKTGAVQSKALDRNGVLLRPNGIKTSKTASLPAHQHGVSKTREGFQTHSAGRTNLGTVRFSRKVFFCSLHTTCPGALCCFRTSLWRRHGVHHASVLHACVEEGRFTPVVDTVYCLFLR